MRVTAAARLRAQLGTQTSLSRGMPAGRRWPSDGRRKTSEAGIALALKGPGGLTMRADVPVRFEAAAAAAAERGMWIVSWDVGGGR